MVVAAKKTSQVIAHLAIAFVITYAMTGSALIGGLALIIEPVINVLLLPFHEKAWHAIRARARDERDRYMKIAAEKISQTALHMVVAFSVMYVATGSLAFGGIAAVLEPICNVILLPIHDRFWEKLELRLNAALRVA
ncbi:DUF2061 domain-containing protein [Massilia sp. G4R7]|uniref:DUF2061 domain-containing protein n=1 Tax=Massilia phyllostachyos TaxID=2898585 RepID=A0ABS8QEJ3_9BURK|nr:DUF2061 domain-containing protein [Massilia phyllostachyos]MCD2519697.1 DUF2061 domain-containing protein [Massilia phyllostachyos]